MAMETMREDDDDQELEVIELPDEKIPVITEDSEQAPAAPAAGADDDDDHEDGDEDARLAASQDDSDDALDPAAADKKKKRKERVDRQRAARERDANERRMLFERNEQLEARLARLEGGHVQTSVTQVDEKLNGVQGRIQQLTNIIGKAVEAGNGDDVAAAMNLRDEAMAERATLFHQKAELETARTTPTPLQADPRVASYIQQWRDANPWYNQGGSDEDSMITAVIDTAIAREGYNPATPEYWQELTRRVSARLGAGETQVDDDDTGGQQPAPRRKVPPQGNTRGETVPSSTRNQVYVTPERKQAMIEAGSWDDPVRRKRQLAEYARYDRENTAR